MPAGDAKHVLILGETLDVCRLKTGARQQEFGLVVKVGDSDKGFVHDEQQILAAEARK